MRLRGTVAVAVTFACGAAYEFGCALWVRRVAEGSVASAVVWSAINAIVTIVGIEHALSRLTHKVAYVAGFAFGTWAAMNGLQLLTSRP